MAKYALPAALDVSGILRRHRTNTMISRSPLNMAVQSKVRDGEHLGLRLELRNKKDPDRGRLDAFIASLNGQEHRAILRDTSYTKPRGTLSSIAEMVTPAFNTWRIPSTVPLYADYAAYYEGVRCVGGQNQNAVILHPSDSSDGITVPTVGASYAGKLKIGTPRPGFDGGLDSVRLNWREENWGTNIVIGTATAEASSIVTAMTCFDVTKMFLRPSFKTLSATDTRGMVQDFYSLSAARCLMVDNPNNALLYSDSLADSNWVKFRTTVVSNNASAPDGTTNGDNLVEDSTAAQTHYVIQTRSRTSAAEFWTASVFIKTNSSQRIMVDIDDGVGSNNGARAYFDATLGTITGGPTDLNSGKWSQASIHDYGDGWYRCRVTAYLPASTSVRMVIYLCDGATNTTTFDGDGSSSIRMFGMQLQQTDQLGQYVRTTSAAVTSATQTGSELDVKGLDTDTAGQLLEGDQIQVGNQLCILQADLDGDQSGCGVAVVWPRIRQAPADDEPVILFEPEGVFMLAGPEQSVAMQPGIFADSTFDFIEDVTI